MLCPGKTAATAPAPMANPNDRRVISSIDGPLLLYLIYCSVLCEGIYHHRSWDGTLDATPERPFTQQDSDVSHARMDYRANFVKTANSNGPGLASWPRAGGEGSIVLLGDHWDPVQSLDPAHHQLFENYSISGDAAGFGEYGSSIIPIFLGC